MILRDGAAIDAGRVELQSFLQALRLKVARTVETCLKKAVKQDEFVRDAVAVALPTFTLSTTLNFKYSIARRFDNVHMHM